jgi:hypothetical protein
MNQFSTQLLMRYLYNETEPTENEAIKQALEVNTNLKAEFESYLEIKELLNQGFIEAPQHIVNEVLKHSYKTSLESAC